MKYEETGRVGDKPILLSGLYEEQGWVVDKDCRSGLYNETELVAYKPILLSGCMRRQDGL